MNCLIIGYGNTLRGDDGVGQAVADRVNAWNLKNVRSLSLHQLTPEIAATIAETETVIFVDAISPTEEPISVVQVHPIQAEAATSQWGHFQDPRSLLLLTQKLYGKTPIAYQILIPAENFAFGETFSPITTLGVQSALQHIQNLINANGPALVN
jgi:hydrogenase maturation protease